MHGLRQQPEMISGSVRGAMCRQQRRKRTSQSWRCIAKNQFLSAAVQKPAAFRTRLQKIWYEGATARKDAENDERSRWLHILAGIVLNTETPMAKLLREKPRNTQLLGAGKRASTLRARVRALRRYALWLSSSVRGLLPERGEANERRSEGSSSSDEVL